jgi:hypothetical protein
MIKETNAPTYRTDYETAEPPCSACSFASTCSRPESCGALRYHVETGRAVRPPRQAPDDARTTPAAPATKRSDPDAMVRELEAFTREMEQGRKGCG